MSIDFTINGKPYSVKANDFPADVTLNTFIREFAKLFGTKFFCLQGICGVCTVTVRRYHPVTKKYESLGVNSCLVFLNMCHQWDIVTIEGLGDRLVGYHPIQERLAHFNAIQCGYCSPGMVMNMFSNLEAAEGNMNTRDIENSFAGNLCRCTGYRPILDSMKSFATNREYEFVDLQHDIEDLKICPKIGEQCDQPCKVASYRALNDYRMWYHPTTIQEIFNVLDNVADSDYMLVAGNTARGKYPSNRRVNAFINLNNVAELKTYKIGTVLQLGANLSLTEMIAVLDEASTLSGYEFFTNVVKHLELVETNQLRNVATIAGHLMIKHRHSEFVSDVFLILATIGAHMIIAHAQQELQEVALQDFLTYDMFHAVIVKILIPRQNEKNTIYDSYKVTPRNQNADAFVNAGFLFVLYGSTVKFSRICFGGIHPDFIESTATVDFLKGRDLFSVDTFNEVLNILDGELNPDWVLPQPSPDYRKKVALGLFYRFILKFSPAGSVSREYVSGSTFLKRPISGGTQTFDTRKRNWPINQPVRKLEALWQSSGEACFANDIPYMRGEVWAAFVTATEVNATVAQLDAAEALGIPGVIAFYSAKDIPGVNSFVTVGLTDIVENEELFCSGVVRYHSQPVGVIIAKTNDLAKYAADRVKVLYERNARATVDNDSAKNVFKYPPGNKSDWAAREMQPEVDSLARLRTIHGYLQLGGQYHFTLEPHTTVCIPREEGLFVYPSSQFIDLVQTTIANALSIKENQIDVVVRQVGGSFGSKISRSNQVTVACALASWLSNRPVRFVLSIEASMKTTGKRYPVISNYTVSVDNRGTIQALRNEFFEDLGSSNNESPISEYSLPSFPNVYQKNESWSITGSGVVTDAPANSWFRGTGNLSSIAMMENIMEHISRSVNLDPADVRMANISSDSDMKQLLPEFLSEIGYRQRRVEIDKFNNENRWKKRGIGISLMRFPVVYFGNFGATVVIYHFDGSVAISHGGVDFGQAINTKVAQVAAFTLDIPLDMVTIKATDSLNGANSTTTGGSITSEAVGLAVQKACNILLERMLPIRNRLQNPTWLDVVKASYAENINLVAHDIHRVGDLKVYNVFGLACSEVALDILTGSFQISRADIHVDTGESLSPLIDVGQIDGAFVQGLGYWLTEKLVYDRQTGELMNASCKDYKVPGVKDIPLDFRVKLLQKKPNPFGFLRSKTTGEVGICLSISALFAVRNSLDSARNDGGRGGWYHLGAPTTIQEIILAADHTILDYKLKA